MADDEDEFAAMMREADAVVQADHQRALADDPYSQTEPLAQPQPTVEEVLAEAPDEPVPDNLPPPVAPPAPAPDEPAPDEPAPEEPEAPSGV